MYVITPSGFVDEHGVCSFLPLEKKLEKKRTFPRCCPTENSRSRRSGVVVDLKSVPCCYYDYVMLCYVVGREKNVIGIGVKKTG